MRGEIFGKGGGEIRRKMIRDKIKQQSANDECVDKSK
jgi:hypothetical protein